MKRVEHGRPSVLGAARILCPLGVQRMRQCKFAAAFMGLYFEGDVIAVLLVLHPPGECKTLRPVDLAILADVLDLLPRTPHREGNEPPTRARTCCFAFIAIPF